jgi:hypothetical protein
LRVRVRRSSRRTVSGGVELAAAKADALAPDARVVLAEHLPPAPVAELGRLRGGSDDVSEENRRQHTIRLDLVPIAMLPNAVQERLDLADDLVRLGEVRSPGRSRGRGERLHRRTHPQPPYAHPIIEYFLPRAVAR